MIFLRTLAPCVMMLPLLFALLLSPPGVDARYELRKTQLKKREGKPRRFAFAPAGRHNKVDADQEPRLLQDALSDPCIALVSTLSAFLSNNREYYSPSFYTACASSLEIDMENMQLHIQSLKDLFKQYHSFHDIAKDPAASDPRSFQEELGNTIFTGEGTGQVDLDAGLDAIEQDILTNGAASMATFWQIEALFNQLHDGHVGLPRVEGDFYTYAIQLIPARFINVNDDVDMTPMFSLDDNNNLQLTLIFTFLDFTREVKVVETINGLSVQNYVVDLANNAALRIPFPTVGARVNHVLQNGALFGQLFIGSGIPTDVLPDVILVTYEGGKEEYFFYGILTSPTFASWVYYPSHPTTGALVVALDFDQAIPFINQPGEQFDAFERAFGITENAAKRMSPRASRIADKQRQNSTRQQSSSFEFTKEIIPGKGAYKIEDEYAVMKLESFLVTPDQMTYLWGNLTKDASDAGVTKLVVDISNNGGGRVDAGFTLLFSMFPFVDIKWFTDQWDINYNDPMRLFLEALSPIMDTIVDDFAKLPDEVFEATIATFTDTDYKVYEFATAAIVELCNDADTSIEGSDVTEQQCMQAYILQSYVENFVSSRDISAYVDLLLSLIDTVNHYNPWSVVLEGTENGTISALIEGGPQTITRGGVESNVTAKFNLLGSRDLSGRKESADQASAAGGNFTFDEIVIVSNGVSGSMAAIFPVMAAQFYKNRAISEVTSKVTLCAYGGTGNPDDFSLSSFPASVQGVHLEDPIIGDAALSLLIGLFPDNLPDEDTIVDAVSTYSRSVAIPPYFGDTLPFMPSISFYDKFMDPGALPLQYVNIPVDAYIPKIFMAVTFNAASDLEALYAETAKLFSFSNIQPPVTTAPVVAPTPGGGQMSAAPDTVAPATMVPIVDVPTTIPPVTPMPVLSAAPVTGIPVLVSAAPSASMVTPTSGGGQNASMPVTAATPDTVAPATMTPIVDVPTTLPPVTPMPVLSAAPVTGMPVLVSAAPITVMPTPVASTPSPTLAPVTIPPTTVPVEDPPTDVPTPGTSRATATTQKLLIGISAAVAAAAMLLVW